MEKILVIDQQPSFQPTQLAATNSDNYNQHLRYSLQHTIADLKRLGITSITIQDAFTNEQA